MSDQLAKTTMSPLLRPLLGNGQSTNNTNPVDGIVSSFNSTSTHLTTTTRSPKLNDLEIHRSNIIWPADPVDEMPVNFPRFYDHYSNNRRLHLSALVPFGVMLVLSTIIFIMIIFRRWPGLVSGIVAGCLTFISIYLLLLTLKEEVLVYE